MKRRSLRTPWMGAILEELMKPPYFMQVAQQGAANGGGDDRQDESAPSPKSAPVIPKSASKTKYEADQTTAPVVEHKPLARPGTTSNVGKGSTSGPAGKTSYPAATEAAFATTRKPLNNSSTSKGVKGNLKAANSGARGSNGPNPLEKTQTVGPLRDGDGYGMAKLAPREVPPAVLQEYGWDVRSTMNLRGVTRVETGEGIFAVKLAHVHPSRLRLIHEVLEFAEQQGFRQFAPMIRTSSGASYVTIDSRTYYALRWLDGATANFASSTQVGQIAYALAELHEQTRAFPHKERLRTTPANLATMMKRRQAALNRSMERIAREYPHSELNSWLKEHRSRLEEDASQATETLASSACEEYLERETARAGLCHLDVIPSNFIFVPNGPEMFIIDYDMAAFAPRAVDLAHLLRRSLQTTFWTTDFAYVGFLNYNNVHPISSGEYRTTAALLRFPHHAWRLLQEASQHGPARPWMDALHSYGAHAERRQQFLDSLDTQIASLGTS
ncbi:MAG: phosphotransferase [Alicyclobacillaceae bacterium]|nr:phosphotransferase [Alicyclobacillaceae bacterium]